MREMLTETFMHRIDSPLPWVNTAEVLRAGRRRRRHVGVGENEDLRVGVLAKLVARVRLAAPPGG
jgi:hypothetical protein